MKRYLLFTVFALMVAVSASASPAYAVGESWFDDSWKYRKQITIQESQIPDNGDLANFPVLVSVNDTDLNSDAQADGDDIRFTSSDGSTLLNYEIESYASGVLTAWVKIPTLDDNANTVIYMYYGNSGVGSAANGANVFTTSDGYAAVYHLNQTSGALNDSTSNANHGTQVAGPALDSSGQINKAVSFDGTSSINLGTGSSLNILSNDFSNTVSLWAKWTGNTGNARAMVNLGDSSNNNRLLLSTGSNPSGQDRVAGGTSTTGTLAKWHFNTTPSGFNNGQFHHIVMTHDSSRNVSLYVDGQKLNVGSMGTANVKDSNTIGDGFHGNFVGTIDEVRLQNVQRSDQWITTEYNNQNNPSAFLAFGSEEQMSTAQSGDSGSSGGNGCQGDCTPPTIGLDRNDRRIVDGGFSYNGHSIDAEPFHTPYPLITAEIGQKNTVSAKAYDNVAVRLVQFGLGIPEIGSPLNDAEVIIEVWLEPYSDGIEEIKITDPHNLVDNDSVTAAAETVACSQGSAAQCVRVDLQHMYREAPMYNVIKVEVMDTSRHVQSTYFNDGIEVTGDSMNPADTMEMAGGRIPNHHPHDSGLLELVQTDRKQGLWVDPYGHVWSGDASRMALVSEIPFERHADRPVKVMDRMHSEWEQLKQEQIMLAQDIFSSESIQGKVGGYHVTPLDVPTERQHDSDLQHRMELERLYAQDLLDEMMSKTHHPNKLH